MTETVTLSLERYENMVEELTDLRSFKNKRSFCVRTQFNDIIVEECKELSEENQRLKLEIEELKRKKR